MQEDRKRIPPFRGSPGFAWAAAALVLCAGILLVLHGKVLPYPFISDDYVFLHETRSGSFSSLFAAFNFVQNYYRPLGRELYFHVGALLVGPHPVLFRIFNLGLVLSITGMTMGLAWRLAGPRAGILAGAVYALLYIHRVTLTWISCAQDLLAATLALAAALVYLSGRRWVAAALYFLALFAKESPAPLPLILLAYEVSRARRTPSETTTRNAAVRTIPLWLAAALWIAIVIAVRFARNAWVHYGELLPVADVLLQPSSMLEGFRQAFLSYVGLDQPWPYLWASFRDQAVPWVAIAMAATLPVFAWAAERAPSGEATAPAKKTRSSTRPPAADALALGVAWALVGAVPIALVGHHFSSYYVTFAAVGWAMLAGTLLARSPVVLAVLALSLSTIVNISANAVNHFRVYPEQVDLRGISNVNFMRLDSEAQFLERLHAALMAHPPGRGGVIYLANAPKYMMLATASERAPKVWFNDPELSFTYISHYKPDDRARSRVVLRYDPVRRNFVYLPPALVDNMVAGEEALAARDVPRARRALENALAAAKPGELGVERVELSNTLGVAANLMGDTLAARQAWEATLALDPAHHEATLNLAALLAGEGRFGAARDLLTRFIEARPADIEALWLLVQVEQAMGHGDNARRLWERIATINPALADSLARGARRR